MMLIHEIHVFELQIATIFEVYNPHSFSTTSGSEEGLKRSGFEPPSGLSCHSLSSSKNCEDRTLHKINYIRNVLYS